MIKVNVMYPYTEGARFDHAYYRDRHMPMMKARLGSVCAYYTVEKGLTGRAPDAPPVFAAMDHYTEDVIFSSPTIVKRWGIEDGWLQGKASLRENFYSGCELRDCTSS